MSCLFPVDWPGWIDRAASPELVSWASVSGSTFALIAAAEFGDKSQLVCMTLAARHHRASPIVLGASAAFAVLNLAAVLFGAAAARWIPQEIVGLIVVALFAAFGLKALFTQEEEESGERIEKSGHGIFLTTFLLIFAAEFGDKTQLAVAGLGATMAPAPTWLGATLALACTSALGVWAGRVLLKRLATHWLHRLSGVLFIAFAGYAASHLDREALLARLHDYLDVLFSLLGIPLAGVKTTS